MIKINATKHLQNLTLNEIENLLQTNRRSLKEFTSMPYPNHFLGQQFGNRLIYAELDYNNVDEQLLFQSNFNSMTGLNFLS